MKKILLIMVSLTFILVGCGSKELTNQEIEEKVKDMGLKIDYEQRYIEDSENLDIILFENKDFKLFYNSSPAWGFTQGKTSIMGSESSGSNYSTLKNSRQCTYDFKKDEVKAHSVCTNTQISTIKKVNKKYKSVLDELGITEKQFKIFAKYEIKKEKKNYKSGTTNGKTAEKNTDESSTKLLALGYKYDGEDYFLDSDIPSFEKVETPVSIMINLEKKNFVYNFQNEGIVVIDWSMKHVYGRNTDDSLCIYSTDSNSWVSDDCGIDKEIFYLKSYSSFLTYSMDNDLSFGLY